MIGCAWIGRETRVANVGRICGEWWFGHFFFPQPSCRSAPTIKTLMQGKLKQKRQRNQKQLQRRHVYGFGYFPFPLLSSKRYLSSLGPLDPQTLGRKELLLDFAWSSYPVRFCEFSVFFGGEHVRICPWRLVNCEDGLLYSDVCVRVLVSTNSTWRLIAQRHCQAHASEDVAEAEAPAEEQAATYDMCLGGSWVSQEDKCQVFDSAWESQADIALNMLKPWHPCECLPSGPLALFSLKKLVKTETCFILGGGFKRCLDAKCPIFFRQLYP